MRAFDAIAEEDIAHDKEIYIAAMGRNDDNGAIVLVVALNLGDVRLVDDDLLVDVTEKFVEEPTEHANRAHRIVAEHLRAELLGYLSQLLLCFFVGGRRIL